MNPSEIKEQLKRRLAEKGDFKFLLSDLQKSIWDKFFESDKDKKRRKFSAFNIARQTGKSFIAGALVVNYCMANPNKRSCIVTGSIDISRKISEQSMPTIINYLPEHLRPVYRTQESRWKFPNGSTIDMRGTDRGIEGFRGSSYGFIVLDECAFYKCDVEYLVKSILFPSMRRVENARMLMITTPAKIPDHYSYKLFDRAQDKGFYFKATIYDDDFTDEEKLAEIIEECGGEDTIEFQREYLCEFMKDLEAVVIPEFSRERHEKEFDLPKDFASLYKYTALDIGGRDNTGLTFGFHNFREAKLYIVDEIRVPGNQANTEVIYDLVTQKEKECFKKYQTTRRFSGSDSKLTLRDLAHKGTYFSQNQRKPLEEQINTLRLMFQLDQIVIHPRCTYLLRELDNVEWNDKHTDWKRDARNAHYDVFASLVTLVNGFNPRLMPEFQEELVINNPNRIKLPGEPKYSEDAQPFLKLSNLWRRKE